MSITNPFEQSELIRLALAGIDAEIAALQEKRSQLATLTNRQSTNTKSTSAAPAPQKGGKMSAEAKAKISAAAKARWARVRKAKAEAAKKAPAKKKAVKAAPTNGKKSE